MLSKSDWTPNIIIKTISGLVNQSPKQTIYTEM